MFVAIATLALMSQLALAAGDNIDAMRGDTGLTEEPTPPRLATVENQDLRRARNYPMQPPTIPHKIDNYRVDLNSNKCLSCHSRRRTEESQAVMISVTHYMDRDGNFLAEVSPRRYFCEQCHVAQTDARPLVDNTFKDVDELLREQPSASQ
jgi:cytochrome c-type protein NapB